MRELNPPKQATWSRRAVLGMAGASAGAALTGCAGTLTQPAPGHVLRLFAGNAAWQAGFDAVSKVLNQKVGLTLQLLAVPNTSTVQQVFRMSARTGTAGDLVKWWNGYRLTDIARSGLLADISGVWDLAERNGWIDDIVLKKTMTFDGKQYGMPMYKSYYVVFYSKKAFQKADVAIPKTWQDFENACEKLKSAKITPIASPGANDWQSCIWFGQLVNGVDHDFYLSVTEGHASYLDQPAVDAMMLWAQLYQRGYFSAPDVDSSAIPSTIRSGSVGMQLCATWNSASYQAAGATADDFGEFLLPSPQGGPSVVVESSSLSVPAFAHKKSAAISAENAWLDPDVQKAWIGFLQDLSANPAVLPSLSATRDIGLTTARQKPSEAIRYWEASPPPLIEGNVQDLSAFMINPTPSNARSTLRKLQQRADVEWKRWNSQP